MGRGSRGAHTYSSGRLDVLNAGQYGEVGLSDLQVCISSPRPVPDDPLAASVCRSPRFPACTGAGGLPRARARSLPSAVIYSKRRWFMVQSSHNEVVLFHSLDLPDPAATPGQVWEICSNHTLKRCLNSEVWRRELSPLIELIFSGWVNVDEVARRRWDAATAERSGR